MRKRDIEFMPLLLRTSEQEKRECGKGKGVGEDMTDSEQQRS